MCFLYRPVNLFICGIDLQAMTRSYLLGVNWFSGQKNSTKINHRFYAHACFQKSLDKVKFRKNYYFYYVWLSQIVQQIMFNPWVFEVKII